MVLELYNSQGVKLEFSVHDRDDENCEMRFFIINYIFFSEVKKTRSSRKIAVLSSCCWLLASNGMAHHVVFLTHLYYCLCFFKSCAMLCVRPIFKDKVEDPETRGVSLHCLIFFRAKSFNRKKESLLCVSALLPARLNKTSWLIAHLECECI